MQLDPKSFQFQNVQKTPLPNLNFWLNWGIKKVYFELHVHSDKLTHLELKLKIVPDDPKVHTVSYHPLLTLCKEMPD